MTERQQNSDRLASCNNTHPMDYKPWGDVSESERDPFVDCSCGCRYFIGLEEGEYSADWGVCTNPASHRAGMLTFEHQGCSQFEYDDRGWDEDEPVTR